jgi:hypothetical protein
MPALHLAARVTFHSFKRELFPFMIIKAIRPSRIPKPCTLCTSHRIELFPAKKGVQNRTFTPDPRTFTKTSPILLQTPLVSWWHKRGAFENPLSDRDFHPAHLGTSRHKLSMQGCSIRSSLSSCILRSGWELWGNNSHRNG